MHSFYRVEFVPCNKQDYYVIEIHVKPGDKNEIYSDGDDKVGANEVSYLIIILLRARRWHIFTGMLLWGSKGFSTRYFEKNVERRLVGNYPRDPRLSQDFVCLQTFQHRYYTD